MLDGERLVSQYPKAAMSAAVDAVLACLEMAEFQNDVEQND